MLPGKTATKKAAAVPPTTARAGCFHVPSKAAPRASSTTPETTTTWSGSAGNHDGTCARNSWRCLVRCPVPAVSSAAPSASWPMAPRARRVVEFAAIDGPPCRRVRQPVHWPPCHVVVDVRFGRYGLDHEAASPSTAIRPTRSATSGSSKTRVPSARRAWRAHMARARAASELRRGATPEWPAARMGDPHWGHVVMTTHSVTGTEGSRSYGPMSRSSTSGDTHCVQRRRSSGRERSRQPERREHALVEVGDRPDPVAGEGEDVEPGPVAEAAAGAQVDPERQLTVGPRRHEVPPPARAPGAGQEARHSVAAVIFEGDRWHGEAGIGGEQGDQRVDVAGVVGADELGHEGPLGG